MPNVSGDLHLRLTLDIAYSTNGEPTHTAVSLLERLVEIAAGDGLLTGNTGMEVETYASSVDQPGSAAKGLSPATKELVFDKVIEAMQPAEEISGPEGEDYINLMRAIADEALTRIDAYRAAIRADQHQGPGA